MKARKLVLLLIACGLVIGLSAAEPVQVLFPYTIVGRVVDAVNKAFEAESGVTLSVALTNGTVLAQTKVYTPGSVSAWNFRLGVPVASAHVAGYAAKGDTLVLTAVKDGIVYKGLLKGDDARIGNAGASVSVRIMLSDDANGNGIADTYEQSKYNWMRKYKISGTFDPTADYDSDGQSNYAEYLAGTDPFDAADLFGIDTLEDDDDYDERYVKLTFEANAGLTYKVVGSAEIASEATPSPQWTTEKFKADPSDSSSAEYLSISRSVWEEKTIYLLKQGDKRFYKLELAE